MENNNIQCDLGSLFLNERKNIQLKGVVKLNGFDENEFFIETTMGNLVIKGEKLELFKYDTALGIMQINGYICEIIYLDKKNNIKNSVVNRLFK